MKREGSPIESNRGITDLGALIEGKIGQNELAGVMMQGIVDGFASGKIKDKKGAEQKLREAFIHNPFSGEKLTDEQVSEGIGEAMAIFDQVKEADREDLKKIASETVVIPAKSEKKQIPDEKLSPELLLKAKYERGEMSYGEYAMRMGMENTKLVMEEAALLDERMRQSNLRSVRRKLGLADKDKAA